MKRYFCFSAILLSLFSSALWALDVPDRPRGYVTDFAGMLSPPAKAKLEALLSEQEIQTSNQVLVVTLPALAGDPIEDFTLRLAEKWKPGQKGKDNGIIFLIARDDREMRIEVGYGLEGVLPDSLAAAIIRNIVTPRFRAGQFEEGLLTGTQAILEAIRGEFKNEFPKEGAVEDPLLPFFKLIGAAAALLFLLDTVRYGRYRISHGTYAERYAFLEWFIRFSVLLALAGVILRLIFSILLSSRGGYYGSRSGYGSFPGGSSRGGFGGGGGGGFGGGGASGRW